MLSAVISDHAKFRRWALALGTPVLVVAGFGHVIPILFNKAAKKLKVKHRERRMSRSSSRSGSRDLSNEKTNESSATSIMPEAGQRSRASSAAPMPMRTNSLPRNITFEIDVAGNDEVISKWPSFVRIEDGKALIQATLRQEDYDLESQRQSPSRGRS